MSFTPSNLAITQLGACKLTIATQNANTASGTDLWTSGIQDIQAVIPIMTSAPTATITTFAVSFTGSTGTIHILRDAGQSNTAFTLLVLSGFASDMTW